VGSSIKFPGRTLRFTNDFAYFVDQVRTEFPAQADRFVRLIETIDGFDELNLDQEPISARQVLNDHLSDPVLIDMLFCPLMFYGSAIPRDMDFSQFVIMFKSIFQQGFARPFEGVRRILKTLVRQFKELGGELKLRHGVSSIHMQNGKAAGVVLEDGTIIEAENVLSSAGVAETEALCRRDTAPEPAAAGELSFNETIYVLDRQPTDLGHSDTIIFYNDAERFDYACPVEPCDIRSGIICSPNNFQYPNGQQLDEGIVRITALANPVYWFNAPQPEYEAAKTNWANAVADVAVKYMPDFRPHVVETDAFTPRTVKKYTGHLNGAVYGAPLKVLTGLTETPNLYLCGTDQGFLGIIGSMLSGITMANNHLLRE
jgi:phytoene dehydrogenase-like protein